MSYGASHKVREIGKEVGTGEYGAAPRIPHTAGCRSLQRTAAQPAIKQPMWQWHKTLLLSQPLLTFLQLLQSSASQS